MQAKTLHLSDPTKNQECPDSFLARAALGMLFDVPGWKVGRPTVQSSFPTKNKKNGSKEVKTLKIVKYDITKEAAVVSETATTATTSRATRPPPDQRATIEKPLTKKTTRITKEEQKLGGARFRYLNQRLYQSSSKEAFQYFQDHPEDFEHYHTGFREQTKAWPVNPVDIFIRRLEAHIKNRQNRQLVVADLGCGEAKIASHFKDNPSIAIHSFDLAATNKLVTVASMTKVPLKDSSTDIAVFSLSLMNTDYSMALCEAFRILGPKSAPIPSIH